MEMSAEDLNALGRRLAAAEPSEADWRAYQAYRESFREPMAEVERAVSGFASAVDAVEIASRLKNIRSVIPKLARKRTALSEMQDIAGVRIVVPSLVETDEVLGWAHAELDLGWEKDYREQGVKHGYRALHLIVRTSFDQVVELQVRTRLQHEWANLSEALSHRYGIAVKSGRGPTELHQRLSVLSDFSRIVDLGVADRIRDEATLHRLFQIGEAGKLAGDLTGDINAEFAWRRIRDLIGEAESVYNLHGAVRGRIDRLAEWEESS